MGYFRKAFHGISWMAGLRAVTRGLALVKIAILARILLPAQFGIYGIATLVLGFLEMLTETGINIFLIQEKDAIDDYVDSAWVVSILRGIVMSIVIILSVPLVVKFFTSPSASYILYLTSLIPLIRGFINPSSVKFQKDLEFNKQFFYDSFLFLIDATSAVTIGLITRSENSLIFAMIVSAFAEVLLSFKVFRPHPRFRLERERVIKVVNRGKWITGAGVFDYLFQNLDDIFVGRILGTGPLGIYQQAYKISSLPVSEVGEIFNKVTFPIYVTIENDKKTLKKAFLTTLLAITLLVIPFGLFVFYFPGLIVKVVLGDRWLSAIPILQLLAVFGVLKAIANSFFSLFLGLGKQEVVTLIAFVATVVMGVTIVPLIRIFGVLGAGYAAIISTLSALPFTIYFAWKSLK